MRYTAPHARGVGVGMNPRRLAITGSRRMDHIVEAWAIARSSDPSVMFLLANVTKTNKRRQEVIMTHYRLQYANELEATDCFGAVKSYYGQEALVPSPLDLLRVAVELYKVLVETGRIK
jgi:hypothetical protein